MPELDLLRLCLLFSLAIAPLGVHRHVLAPSGARLAFHILAWGSLVVAFMAEVGELTVAWLLFTAVTFGEFLLREQRRGPSLAGLVRGLPLLFSNVSAVWIVAGSNDLGLLGYGPAFSLYAALHGAVLGWITVGAFAILASERSERRHVHAGVVLLASVAFVLVAVGIDQFPRVKPVGVAGLSVALAVGMAALLRDAWGRDRIAFGLGAAAVLALGFTMVLAWRNEFGAPELGAPLGVRGMVSLHGVVNVVFVAPFVLLAATRLERAARLAQRAESSRQ